MFVRRPFVATHKTTYSLFNSLSWFYGVGTSIFLLLAKVSFIATHLGFVVKYNVYANFLFWFPVMPWDFGLCVVHSGPGEDEIVYFFYGISIMVIS